METLPEAGGSTFTVSVNVQLFAGAALLCGFGAPGWRSAELLSVSTQPLPSRTSAVVFVSAAAGEVSEQFAAPYPTRSSIVRPPGHVPECSNQHEHHGKR